MNSSAEWYPELSFCGILEAPLTMMTSVPLPGRPDNFILQAAEWAERKLHKAGLLDAWNQYVLINLVKRP